MIPDPNYNSIPLFVKMKNLFKLSPKSNELILASSNFGFSLFPLLVPANNDGKSVFIKIVFNMSPCLMAL